MSSFMARNSDSVYAENLRKESITRVVNLPNPNPKNYKILRNEYINKCIIIEIQYGDCENYEGRKILLFENCTLNDLIKQKLIDPHFCENKKVHSPIARFEPTERGWEMAKFLTSLFL